jgi:pyridoxamine 5'-phosphate oxidase
MAPGKTDKIMTQETPFSKTQNWLTQEATLSPANPNRIVLATSTKTGIPHSRIVAIREITPKGVLFFTQRNTRKVREMLENKAASMTLWLPQQQRQVVIDGVVEELTREQNKSYWDANPKEQQLRFTTYAPTSGQTLPSSTYLSERLATLTKEHENEAKLPLSEDYVGFYLVPKAFYFYTLGTTGFSEIEKFFLVNEDWKVEFLSP